MFRLNLTKTRNLKKIKDPTKKSRSTRRSRPARSKSVRSARIISRSVRRSRLVRSENARTKRVMSRSLNRKSKRYRNVRRKKSKRSKSVRKTKRVRSRRTSKKDGIKENIGICEKCEKEKIIEYGFENLCHDCYLVYETAGYKSLINTVQKYELDLPDHKREIKKTLYDMIKVFKEKYRFGNDIFRHIGGLIKKDYNTIDISKISNNILKNYENSFDIWRPDDIIENIKKDIKPIISFFQNNKDILKTETDHVLQYFKKIDEDSFIRTMYTVDRSIYEKYYDSKSKIKYLSPEYSKLEYNQIKDIYNHIFEKIYKSLSSIQTYLNSLNNIRQILLCIYIIIMGIDKITFNEYDNSLYSDKYDKMTEIDYKVNIEHVTKNFIKNNRIDINSYYILGFIADEDNTLSLTPIKISRDYYLNLLMIEKNKGIITTGKIYKFDIDKNFKVNSIKLKNFLLNIDDLMKDSSDKVKGDSKDKKESICNFILSQKDGFTMLCDEDIKYWNTDSEYNVIENDPPYYKIVVPGGCLFCGKQDSSKSQNGYGNSPKICIVCCVKKLYPDDNYIKQIKEQDCFLNLDKSIYDKIHDMVVSKDDRSVDVLDIIVKSVDKTNVRYEYNYETDKDSIGTYCSKDCIVCNKDFGSNGNVAYNIHYSCASAILGNKIGKKNIWGDINSIRKDLLMKHTKDMYITSPIIKKIFKTILNFKEKGSNYYCDLCSCYHPSNTEQKFFAQFIYKKNDSKNYNCVEFNIKESYLLKEDGEVFKQDKYPEDLANKLLNFFIGKISLHNIDEIRNLYSKSTGGLFGEFKKNVGDSDFIFSKAYEFLEPKF